MVRKYSELTQLEIKKLSVKCVRRQQTYQEQKNDTSGL